MSVLLAQPFIPNVLMDDRVGDANHADHTPSHVASGNNGAGSTPSQSYGAVDTDGVTVSTGVSPPPPGQAYTQWLGDGATGPVDFV